jgi:predicted Zn-dependent protease
LRLFLFVIALGGCLGAQPAKVDNSTPVGQAFIRMYNFDFAGAQALLDRQISRDPETPLPYSVKAAAHLFSELHRLKILQMDFFEDDDRVTDRRNLTPDPAVRAEMFRLMEAARARANARLAAQPGDRDALFTLCMCAGLETDYAALVERRRLGSFSLAKQSQAYAQKLLALDPPYYDAHLTAGSYEYVVGSLYFFVRWFVRIDGIQGSKQKAIEHLRIVAERGRFYGPFARVLLAVIHLREKRPWEAEELLAGLAAEFPENPLFPRELARARELARLRRPAVSSYGSGAR